MTHHCACLIVVAIATVSFSTPITAQQEPTPSPTLETLVETLGGRVSQNEQGEVVTVDLSRTGVTDAGLAHLTGLTALETLELYGTPITDAGLVHLSGLTTLKTLGLSRTQVTDAGLVHLTGLMALERLWIYGTQVTEVGVAKLQKALPNARLINVVIATVSGVIEIVAD